MRFRVRCGSDTVAVDVGGAETKVGELVGAVQRVLAEKYAVPAIVRPILSLNKKTPLVASEAAESLALKDLGLASGDLLFVLNSTEINPLPTSAPPLAQPVSPAQQARATQPLAQTGPGRQLDEGGKSDVSDFLVSKLVEMGFDRAAATEAVRRTGGKDLQAAVGFLCTPSENTCEQPIKVQKTDANPTPLADEKDVGGGSRGEEKMAVDAVEEKVASMVVGRGEVSERLSALYASAQPQTLADSLFVAVHCCLADFGFVVIGGKEEGGMGMPAGCKTPALYALCYMHPLTGATNPVTVKGVVLGPMLLVHASANQSPATVHTAKFKVTDFVAVDIPLTAGPRVYRQLGMLVQQFKKEIGDLLLDDLRESAGIRNLASLAGLAPELQLLILSYLPAHTLAVMSQVSRQFHALASDPALWMRLYKCSFKSLPPGVDHSANWKQLYGEEAKRRRERERFLRRLSDPLPFFLIPPPNPLWPGAPLPTPGGDLYPRVPGMWGGDYDRLPGFPFAPGPTPSPFGPMGGPLPPGYMPGARFDPFGPGGPTGIDPRADPFGPQQPDPLGIGRGRGGMNPFAPRPEGRGRGQGSFGSPFRFL